MADKKPKRVTGTKQLSTGEYKDHDMLIIGPADDRYPFQFGKNKAKHLLEALEVDGPDAVIAALRNLVGEVPAEDQRQAA